MNPISQRKDDHLELTLQQNPLQDPFEEIRFIHHSLPQLSAADISLKTHWAGSDHAYPLYINAMTGGSQRSRYYNQELARIAALCQIPMAVGSVSAAIKDPSLSDSYQVIRKVNPDGFILANIGANHDAKAAQIAIDLLEADALQIHLNAPQEVVMPEGDRDFSQWMDHIQAIVESVSVPVIVKEVGFGMSQKTIQSLIQLGVQTIDLSGRGGTNFIQVENSRRTDLGFQTLSHWGQTTPESLLESLALQDQVEILASGGIRHFYDHLKALALGAKACGIAGPIIKTLDQLGPQKALEWLQAWLESLRASFLILGVKDLSHLQKTDLLLSGSLLEWAQVRQVDYQALSRRSG